MGLTVSRLKTFLIDAVIAVLAFLVLQTAVVKTYNTYVKIRWAFSVIDQLGPDQYRFLPQPPDKEIEPADLAKWVKSNLPKVGAKDYAAVAAVFLDTADQLRSGDLEGKSQAYAYTARELARVVDRATWTPFLTELVKRAETEPGDLADLFETVGTAIKGEVRATREAGEEGEQ